jgi:AmpD protein
VKRWQADGWLADVRHVLSPNQGARPAGTAVSLVVVHNISLPPGEFGGEWVENFFVNRLDPQAHPYFATIAGLEVSSHFYVRRSGRIVQFVGCDRRAWHAGRSAWQGRENCNDYSVGIELEGCDDLPFEAAQYEALWNLIDALRGRYPISAIAGHSDVASGRKTDPGPYFDWAAVRERYPTLDLPPAEEAA